MATLEVASRLSILESMNRIAPNGEPAKIAEVLTKENQIWMDIVWLESNNIKVNDTVRRLSLPTSTKRRYNRGTAPQASKTTKVVDSIAVYEGRSEVDVEWLKDQPDQTLARNNESIAHIEGMSQDFITDLFYADGATDTDAFTGFAARTDALDTTYHTVEGCNGTGDDLTSIYVVQWGENQVHCVYPRGQGQTLGVDHEDKGEIDATDGDGNKFRAMLDLFHIRGGLVVKNPRCLGRIANIESAGSSTALDEDCIIKVLNHMPQAGAGAKLYMNATAWTHLCILAKDKTNVAYAPQDPWGRPLYTFMGHPVRICESILNTESALT